MRRLVAAQNLAHDHKLLAGLVGQVERLAVVPPADVLTPSRGGTGDGAVTDAANVRRDEARAWLRCWAGSLATARDHQRRDQYAKGFHGPNNDVWDVNPLVSLTSQTVSHDNGLT